MKCYLVTMKKLLLILFIIAVVFFFYIVFINRESFSNNAQNVQVYVTLVPSPTVTPNPILLLTTEQKIGQLLAVSIVLSNNPNEPISQSVLTNLSQIQPSIVVLYGKNLSFDTVKKSAEVLKSIPIEQEIKIAVDHEGGTVQRLTGHGFTFLESWQYLCSESEEERKEKIQKSAKELKDAGIDIIFGPVADFSDKPSRSMGTRICATQADTVIDRVNEVIAIYLENGILPTVKHFPGIGTLNVDLHHNYETINDPTNELTVFNTILQKNPEIAVMTAHAGIPQEKKPCSLSKKCIHLLKDYPKALIITDAIDMIYEHKDSEMSKVEELTLLSKESILAGNHIVLFGPGVTLEELKEILMNLSEQYERDVEFARKVDDVMTSL